MPCNTRAAAHRRRARGLLAGEGHARAWLASLGQPGLAGAGPRRACQGSRAVVGKWHRPTRLAAATWKGPADAAASVTALSTYTWPSPSYASPSSSALAGKMFLLACGACSSARRRAQSGSTWRRCAAGTRAWVRRLRTFGAAHLSFNVLDQCPA